MQSTDKIIDFHAHILPAFDDGPSTCKEAAEILVKLYEQGVTHVVSTSHFYRHDEEISDFIIRRKKAYDKLTAYLCENNITHIPHIIMGAEVYFTTALADDPNLEKLCIEGTDYMLVELPYTQLTENVLASFGTLAAGGRVRPILAHIERYARFADEKTILSFLEYAPGQLNCDSVLTLSGSKLASKLIRSGRIAAIGSDAHNMTSRPPRYSEARKKLSRKMGTGVFSQLMNLSDAVLNNEAIF